jgi:hypothetical protein
VGNYRILFWYRTRGRRRVLRCEYAERRSLVYQLFSAIARTLRP